MNNRFKFRVWDGDKKKYEYFELHNITVPDRLLYQDKFPVQQYTGLKDSKGTEVWEGDIIKYTRLIEKERRIVEFFSFIKYQDAKFGFDLTGFNDMFYDLSDESDPEVIGNIFENSELLKQ